MGLTGMFADRLNLASPLRATGAMESEGESRKISGDGGSGGRGRPTGSVLLTSTKWGRK